MTNSGGDQTRPAKARSTQTKFPTHMGEKDVDAMRDHQVMEGIKREKPTVGAHETMHRMFEEEMKKGGMKVGR